MSPTDTHPCLSPRHDVAGYTSRAIPVNWASFIRNWGGRLLKPTSLREEAAVRWPVPPANADAGPVGPLLVITAIIVGCYFLLILAAPHFGPLDDHMLAVTILRGELLPPLILPELGRFYPLNGQELNLVSFFSISAFAFYFVNAVELIVLAWLFFSLMRGFAGDRAALAALLMLVVSPGFSEAWLRLFVPERGSLLFFVVFLWCYFRYEQRYRLVYAIGALLAANLALYYKEPGFIMLGTFSVVRLLGEHVTGSRRRRMVDALLLMSAAAYALIYYLLVWRHRGPVLYGHVPYSTLLVAGQNLVSYATGDPILFFLIIPLAVWRSAMLLSNKATVEPRGDALLLAAVAYMATYLLLNMFMPRYWLPAYAFAWPALLHFWTRLQRVRRLFGIMAAATVFSLITSAIPSALYYASYWKYVPRNYSEMVRYLAAEAKARNDGTLRIYLDGVQRDPEGELFASLLRFLDAAGVPPGRVVLFPDGDSESTPRTGDYLLITPFTFNNPNGAYLARLEHDYRLVWRTESPYSVPNLNLRVLLKYVALKYLLPEGGSEIRARQNFTYSLDYFLFVRR
jgi:hypothetical protein